MLEYQKREFSLLRLLGAGIVVIGSLAMILATFSVISDIKNAPDQDTEILLVSEIPAMGSGTTANAEDVNSIAAYQYAEITPASGNMQDIYLDDMLQNVSVAYQDGQLVQE